MPEKTARVQLPPCRAIAAIILSTLLIIGGITPLSAQVPRRRIIHPPQDSPPAATPAPEPVSVESEPMPPQPVSPSAAEIPTAELLADLTGGDPSAGDPAPEASEQPTGGLSPRGIDQMENTAIPVPVPPDRYSGLLYRSPFVMKRPDAPAVVESNFGQNYKLVSVMRLGDVDTAVLQDNTTQQYVSVTSEKPEKQTQIQIESIRAQAGLQRGVVLRRGTERATIQLDASGIPDVAPIKTFHSPDAVQERTLRRRAVESNFVPFSDPQVLLHGSPDPLKLEGSGDAAPFSLALLQLKVDCGTPTLL